MPQAIVPIAGAVISSQASKKASKAQAAAAAQATDVQERMYNQSREDLAPYREHGYQANDQLSYLLGLNPYSTTNDDGTTTTGNYDNVNKSLGNFGSLTKKFTLDDYTADPGYQFRQQQGQKALEAIQAKRGNFYSGGALKEGLDFNSGLASQEYGNAYNRYNQDQTNIYNRLAGVTNSGLGATNTGVQSNTQNADAMGNIYGQLGNAKAAAAINQGNIYSGALGNMFGGGSSYGGSSGAGINPYSGLPYSGRW